jgi:hypothetical protein
VLGELDGQHRADGVSGVCKAGAQAQRLRAHVQLLADDRRQGLKRCRERQVRDQREHHHGRHGGIPAGKRSLAHLSTTTRRRLGRADDGGSLCRLS